MNDALDEQVIEQHEGERLKAYYDTRGRLTIGDGFNLDGAGAAGVCERAGVNYQAVRAGQAITQAQCDAIFALQYADVRRFVRAFFPGIDTWPDAAAAVACDLVFELGTGTFLTFRDTILAFKAKNWAGVIAGIRDSKLAEQVPNRVKDNIAALRAVLDAPSRVSTETGDQG